jgi:hypothetical protein
MKARRKIINHEGREAARRDLKGLGVPEEIRVGERVEVRLESAFWKERGWLPGTVVRIDPYSPHRSFYWVELDQEARAAGGGSVRLVSVLNPKNIRTAGA